jgi:hypothetical protein
MSDLWRCLDSHTPRTSSGSDVQIVRTSPQTVDAGLPTDRGPELNRVGGIGGKQAPNQDAAGIAVGVALPAEGVIALRQGKTRGIGIAGPGEAERGNRRGGDGGGGIARETQQADEQAQVAHGGSIPDLRRAC